MNEWWQGLEQLEQVYWIIALISSVFFVILMIGTFISGFGADADMSGVDAEVEGDHGIGFQFFTFKNVVGFFTIFAWSGLACIHADMSPTATIIISVISGLIMMTAMATLFYFMMKMTHSGTLVISNAVGTVGEVYLTIGKDRSSMGKIHINVQGSMRELDAMTDEDFDLKQGDIVKVIEVVSGEILLVEKIKKSK